MPSSVTSVSTTTTAIDDADDSLRANDFAPRALPPPPVPEPPPHKPRREVENRSKSRKVKFESLKADAELARAHEIAVRIAHQRSRRRILKKCFLHFALFIIMETERATKFTSVLGASKSLRIKMNVLRRWRAFTSLMKSRLEKFLRVRKLKTCRGLFSTWFSVTKDNKLVLEGFFKGAEWRMKGRCFSSIVKFARNAKWER